jgi:lysylphosphatidylglycerol synthetase-like protein (DUF2156 family)
MTTGEFNPYQAPAADLTAPGILRELGELRPVPFEDTDLEPRFWPRVWAMFPALFNGPLELAERIPVTNGLGAPWRFQMVLTIPLFLLILVIAAIFGAVMLTVGAGSTSNEAPAWLFALMPLLYLVILPPMQFINMILIGGLTHACLWMWGGLKQGQGSTATFRLTGYFLGFFMLVGFIPIIGSLAALVGPAFLGIAMARIHRTDTWRGICAAYTPLVVICCAFLGLFLLLLGLEM